METVYKLAIVLALSSGSASAQAVPKAYLRDSTLVAKNVMRFLFAGIALSDRQETQAMTIVKKTFREQLAPRTGSSADVRMKGMALATSRDSALKTLLKSKSDKAAFERNATAFRNGASSPPPIAGKPPTKARSSAHPPP